MENRFKNELSTLKKIDFLNPHNLDSKDAKELPICYGARTVILTEDNKIVLIKVEKGNYFTLVGGGIEEGETIEEGMIRECKEESGYDVSIVTSLGYIELWRKKYCRFIFGYLVRSFGKAKPLSLTDEEIELGHSVYLCSIDEAISHLQNDIDKKIYLKDNLASIRSLKFLKEAQTYLKENEYERS